ncbi:MAG: hypothetical protein PHT31_00270 [Candidatus Omnitrophica bacterium]|nr:hypothetical protein [Candidatus Omnitrophota bacterium]MDD5652580.1 hypothetical protein [Candidatus Omnitrophota bacterium]
MFCAILRAKFILTLNKHLSGKIFLFGFLLFPVFALAEMPTDIRAGQINQFLDLTESVIHSRAQREDALNSVMLDQGLSQQDPALANDPPAGNPLIEGSKDASNARKSTIEKVLSKLEFDLAMEYGFCVQGEQTFEVIDGASRKISRLFYPNRGQMYGVKGEMGYLDKFFLGGKFDSSLFKKSYATDTDWQPATNPDIWFESHSREKAQAQLSDINFYYRLLDLNADTVRENKQFGELFDLFKMGNPNDSLIFDLLVGYQWQKSRYRTTDKIDTVEWWVPTDNPIAGEDSFYKVFYRGPRFGFRTLVTSGRFSGRMEFAYAWLTTKAYGWWNLTNNVFEQHGRNGFGIDASIELDYKITSHLMGGVAFNYFLRKQRKLKESANQPGLIYDNEDFIRNVNSILYYPSVILRYIW